MCCMWSHPVCSSSRFIWNGNYSWWFWIVLISYFKVWSDVRIESSGSSPPRRLERIWVGRRYHPLHLNLKVFSRPKPPFATLKQPHHPTSPENTISQTYHTRKLPPKGSNPGEMREMRSASRSQRRSVGARRAGDANERLPRSLALTCLSGGRVCSQFHLSLPPDNIKRSA